MSFEKYRCMFNSEDNADEEYAVCLYPKCWIMECPHKQARDRLAKAQEHFTKLPKPQDEKYFIKSFANNILWKNSQDHSAWVEDLETWLRELEEALKGAMSNGRSA